MAFDCGIGQEVVNVRVIEEARRFHDRRVEGDRAPGVGAQIDVNRPRVPRPTPTRTCRPCSLQHPEGNAVLIVAFFLALATVTVGVYWLIGLDMDRMPKRKGRDIRAST